MARQRIGYIRVSTLDQNPERQLEDISVDRTFVDKASGKDFHRPELEALIDFIRSGDTLVAKQRGAYRGRKRILSEKGLQKLKGRVASGEKKAQIARDFGISRETLYQYLRVGT